MSKCSNCGAELDAGAKFCMECGTPVPQVKKCVQCGMELPLKAKFCFGCGAPQEGTPADAAVSMGDKNVIAGDVIGQKVAGDNVQNKIMGNAVFNTYQDDTKIVNDCAICGMHMTNDVGHTCPSCGKIVCKKHFDENKNLCTQCIQRKKELAEQEYDSLLKTVYEDGVVNPAERQKLNDLRKKLGISKETADALEMRYQSAKSDELTKIENLVIQSVQDLLWNDINSAYKNITDVYKNHPSDEYVLTWYLRVARVADSEKTLELIEQQKIDCEEACLSLVDINLERNRLNDAEIALDRCKQIWSNSFSTKCYELYYLIMVSLKTNTDAYLDEIKSKMEGLPTPSDVYERYLLNFIKAIQSIACKEEAENELFGFWKKRFDRIRQSIAQNTGTPAIRLNHDDVVCPQDKWELIEIIKETVEKNGYSCDLNFIDVSKVTDMSCLFCQWDYSLGHYNSLSAFNGNISQWNVSNVTDMSHMFSETKFNGDISQWDVSSVKNMERLFYKSEFNGDISKWNVSNVTNMGAMFCGSKFKGDVSQWDVSKVTNVSDVFRGSQIERYPKIRVKDKKELAELIGTIVQNKPNCDLNFIDVSQIQNMASLFSSDGDFYRSQFNGDISQWDVSNVTDMSHMFYRSQFKGDISKWNVSSKTDMTEMFDESHIEQYPDWFKIRVKDKDELKKLIARTIEEKGLYCNLNFIDVSNIKDMSYLFQWSSVGKSFSSFNGDISQWDVSNVTDMSHMFYSSQFNGDISKWNVSPKTNMRGMFDRSHIKQYPDWFKRRVENNKELIEVIHEYIQNNGSSCDLNFIDVSKINDMSNLFSGSIFNGDISKWDVSNVTNMTGMFYDSQFNGDVSKWNVSNVKKMKEMFRNSRFKGDISKWNVSNVTDMSHMFYSSQFNGDISKWDVSNVTDMAAMFSVSQFTGDISQWDVSNVTDMSWMFRESQFNGDISQWNVSNVKRMSGMFKKSRFNGDLSHWDMSKVESIGEMFFGCASFCGDVSSWKLKSKVDQDKAFEGSHAVHSKIASFVKRFVKK